jgi:hypothetical protein
MSENSTFGKFLLQSAMAGMLIGVLQALVGYFPRADVLIIAVSAALVGGVVGVLLGLILYPLFSPSIRKFAALRAVALVSGVIGICASIFIRWWSRGESAVVSMFVTPPLAIVLAITIKLFLSLTNEDVGVEHSRRPSGS